MADTTRMILTLIVLFAAFVVGSRVAHAQRVDFELDTLAVDVSSRASADLAMRTRSLEIVTRERIRSLPASSVSELLRWSTGLDLLPRSRAQADVSIRGAGFEQLLVLVNGTRVSDPQTGHFDLDLTVPLDQVERVEILRGPASALYGADAVGGVVNIVTRRSGPAWESRFSAGSFGTASLAASGGTNGGGVNLRAASEFTRSDGHRAGTDYRIALAHVNLSAPLSAGHLKTELGFARRAFGAAYFYASNPSFDEYEETGTVTAAASWLAPIGSTFRLEPRVTLRRHDDEFLLRREDPDFYRNTHTSWQVGGELVARYVASEPLHLALGGELYHDALDSNNLGKRSEYRGALFSELVLGRRDLAVVVLGLRQDWHEGFGSHLSPSFSGAVELEPARLRAAIGRSFRAPSWTDRYYTDPANIARADLDPERSWSGELGADIGPRSRRIVSVTGFVRLSTDLIDWSRTSADEPWETRNVESATFHGIELDIAPFDALGLRWRAGGSLIALDVEEANGFESKSVLRPLTHSLSLGLGRPITGAVELHALGSAGRYRDGEDFARVDLRGLVSLPWGSLRIDVTNLTDVQYLDVTRNRSVAGRALLVAFVAARETDD